MSAVLTQIQAKVKQQLISDPYFADISIVTELEGDIDTKIETALQQLGVGVVISTPHSEVTNEDVPDPYMDVKCVISCIENVLLNRGQGSFKTATEIAEMAAALMHLHVPTGEKDSYKVEGISLAPVPGILGYDVHLRTEAGLHMDPWPQVEPLVFSGGTDGDPLTMTCATGGAAIFYRTDGQPPSPRFGTLYTAPVTLTPGTAVIARAWLDGYFSSETSTTTTS